jgi:1-acyl-sn-glycerol-3-phosphate acyltransferase
MFAKIRGIYVLLVTAFLLIFLVGLISIFRKWNRALRKAVSKAILFASGIRLQVVGKAEADTTMFIINHQSMMDIMSLESAINKHDLAWVAKRELFEMKVFGYLLRLPKMINLDRESKRGIVHLIRESRDRLKNGRVIAIFPEGTRNLGKGLLEFKKGASIVANRFKLKVQPVVIRNSNRAFNVKELTSEGNEIEVVFLPQISANESEDWLERSRNEMLQVLERAE